jgi:hypothetical protein
VGKPWPERHTELFSSIFRCMPVNQKVFSEMSLDFLDECAHYCLKDVYCVGYNFKAKQNKKPNCQLTHKLDHEFHSCNEEDKGWSFFHGVGPRKVGRFENLSSLSE